MKECRHTIPYSLRFCVRCGAPVFFCHACLPGCRACGECDRKIAAENKQNQTKEKSC